MKNSSPAYSLSSEGVGSFTQPERSTACASPVVSADELGLGVRVTELVFVFVELAVFRAVVGVVSTIEAKYKKNPTRPPPQTRMRIANIPRTHTHVLEDFFFGCMGWTG